MRTDAATPSLLSPELALVDPGLAGSARALLPDGGEGEVWRLRFPTRPLAAVPVVVAPVQRKREGPRLRVLVGAGALCAAATAVAYGTDESQRPYLVEDVPQAQAPTVPARPPAGGVAATSVAIRTTPAPRPAPAQRPVSRRAGKGEASLPVRVAPPPARRRPGAIRSVVRLGWSARSGATYYRVRIRRARARDAAPVLEIWTVRPGVAVRLASPGARSGEHVLPAGTYRWSAFPVSSQRFGSGAPSRRPVAEGEFTLGS